MNRILSGVLQPEFEEKPGVAGVGGAKLPFSDVVGEKGVEEEAIVVDLCRFVVSADGGGGRD